MQQASHFWAAWKWTLLSAAGCLYAAYGLERTDFGALLGLYGLLGYAYWRQLRRPMPLRQAWTAALGLRLLFLFSMPALSDDYVRFAWDGRLAAAGVNPFAQLPGYYLLAGQEVPGLSAELFGQLNSPGYFTVYPAVCQAVFGLSAWLAGPDLWWQTVLLRLLVLGAEVFTLLCVRQLQIRWKLPEASWALYALHPAAVVELSGNLHPEAFMLAGLAGCLVALERGKIGWAALGLAAAVHAKLLPLMLVPALLPALGWGRWLRFGALAAGWVLLGAWPLFDPHTWPHLADSLQRYFRHFEFNASLYYLVREAGYAWKGYNIIAWSGPWLSRAALLGILAISWRRGRLALGGVPHRWLWAFACYWACAPIVHPWYAVVPAFLAALGGGRWRWALAWPMLAVFSYQAYQQVPYWEDLRWVAAEYLLVGALLLRDLRRASASAPTGSA